jgi:hypothetical protein
LAEFLLASSEDYLLLFAVAPRKVPRLAEAPAGVVNLGLAVEAAHGYSYIDELGAEHALAEVGWQHRG